MTSPFSDVTGYVLVGGKSSRMGTDKALLRLPSGETLCERTLRIVGSVCSRVRLVGPRERYADFVSDIVEDEFPDRGPIGGVHAALQSTSTEVNLIVAVDMPRLTPELLRYMAEQGTANSAIVTLPVVDGRDQPLCAIYRKKFASFAEAAIQRNDYKLARAFPPDRTTRISQSQLKAAGFAPELFMNTNTLEEWSRSFN